MKPSIKYPSFVISSLPTPSNTLYVCDKCGKAEWSYSSLIKICNGKTCICKKDGQVRMRLATEKETAEGLLFLKQAS